MTVGPVQHLPYVGSGPYCYANSFAMMFGDRAPSTAVIEFVTGGSFGMQLVGGTQPFFDAYGWNPERGFEAALAALGWRSDVASGGDAESALARLVAATMEGPVWVGPLEMGHLHHQPEMTGPLGADHYVVVLEVDNERALVHDPQGYPYASVPLDDFMASWRAETVDYGEPYTMRTGFEQVAEVDELTAIRSAIPAAIGWLSLRTDINMPPGSLGNAAAAERLAELIETGAENGLREHLIYFAIRVGARRLSDVADGLARIGFDEASRIAATQARLVGSMQHPMVTGDLPAAAHALRELAPTHDRLRQALEAASATA